MNFISDLLFPSSSSNPQPPANSFQTPPPKQRPSQALPLPALDNTTFSPSRCVVHPLPLDITSSWFLKHKPFAIVIDNILTPEECQQWIEHTEEHSGTGYETALVNIGGGKQMQMLDYRKSSRCIIDDSDRANDLFERIRPFLLASDGSSDGSSVGLVLQDRIPYELNERLRFLRYDPGEYFAPHLDGRYDRPTGHPRDGDYSLITFQLYLNDGFTGGTTRFFHSKEDKFYDVVPKAGSVLLFEHRMEHSGELVVKGRKYAMRTDIMFTKNLPVTSVVNNAANDDEIDLS